MNIKIINKSKNKLPEYATSNSAGMDIRAEVDKLTVLKPMETKLIKTGLYIQLPAGSEAQIRPTKPTRPWVACVGPGARRKGGDL